MTNNTKENIMTDNTKENIMIDNIMTDNIKYDTKDIIIKFNKNGFTINDIKFKYSTIPYMSPEELKILSKLPDEILNKIDNYYKLNN